MILHCWSTSHCLIHKECVVCMVAILLFLHFGSRLDMSVLQELCSRLAAGGGVGDLCCSAHYTLASSQFWHQQRVGQFHKDLLEF